MQVASALIVSLASRSAPAQAPSSPAPPSAVPTTPLGERLRGSARADYEAGRLLFGDRDYSGALVKFRSAYDQSKEPRLLFNMAACEKNLRHYARTIADFERYRSEGGAGLTQAEVAEVDRLLAELRPFVGNLRITVNEPGASVYIDQTLAGTTPLSGPQAVDIGDRQIRIVKDGFQDATMTVTISGQGEARVDAALEKIVHEGRLLVHAGARDAIAIDGQLKATGTLEVVLGSGGHQLRVTAPGMQPFQSEVVISDGQARTVDVSLQPQASTGLPAWVWIAGGAVLVTGAAVGGYFAFKTKEEPASPTAGSITPGFVTLSLPR
jgi:hypothetical protein